MLGPVSLRKLPGGHKLQHNAGRAADGHLALLPAPDGAQVADTQHASKLGLRETEPLADGFDFRWCHVGAFPRKRRRVQPASSLPLGSRLRCYPRRVLRASGRGCNTGSQAADRSIRELPRHCLLKVGATGQAIVRHERVETPRGRLPERVEIGAVIAGGRNLHDDLKARNEANLHGVTDFPRLLGAGAVGISHFHSPLSGGALPRSMKPLWGPMPYRVKQNRAFRQIIFEGAAK